MIKTFSLINVYKTENNKVEGNWIQDHIGTIESAIEEAIKTESVNSNRIDVAVVDKISSATPILSMHYNLIRLDVRRNKCQ